MESGFRDYARNDGGGTVESGFRDYTRNDRSGTMESGFRDYTRNDRSGTMESGFRDYTRNDRSGTMESGFRDNARNDRSGTMESGFRDYARNDGGGANTPASRFVMLSKEPRTQGGARFFVLEVVSYLLILVTRPAPTVRPPSRIANLRPSSMAMGLFSTTDMSVVSPGITISVPSGS